MKIELQLTASPELLTALNNIAAALTGSTPKQESPVVQMPTEEKRGRKKKEEAPVVEEQAPVGPTLDKPLAADKIDHTTPLTIDDIKAKAREKAQVNKEAVAKLIKEEFGLGNINSLPEEKYEMFITRLEAI